MKRDWMNLNLRQFEGAAGAAPAGAAPAGASPAGGEGSAGVPAAGENRAQTVRYGMQSDSDGAGESQPGRESVSEAAEGEQAPAAGERPEESSQVKTTSDTLEARKAEFEKLIKGEYKDLFDQRMHAVINRRFAETRALQEQSQKVRPILDTLRQKYGVADVDQLARAIENDDSYYEQEAEEQGISVQQLKRIKKMERENQELRRAREEMQRRQGAEKVYQKWVDEADQVKAVYPGFDLEAEIKNPGFARMLRAGVDLKTAYQVLHMDEVIGGAMSYTASQVAQATVANIKAKAARPAENGINAGAGVIVKNDVSKLSADDRREIARRVARGEEIRF